MSMIDITVAPRRVTVFFDHHQAPSTAADQRRIAREIDNAMALAPFDLPMRLRTHFLWRRDRVPGESAGSGVRASSDSRSDPFAVTSSLA